MFHINYFNGYIIFPHWMRHHSCIVLFCFKESLCLFASHSTPFIALQVLQIMTNWEILSRIDVLMFFYSKSEFEPPTTCVDSWHQLFGFPSRSGINIAFIPSSKHPTPTLKKISPQNQFLGSTKSRLPPHLGFWASSPPLPSSDEIKALNRLTKYQPFIKEKALEKEKSNVWKNSLLHLF